MKKHNDKPENSIAKTSDRPHDKPLDRPPVRKRLLRK